MCVSCQVSSRGHESRIPVERIENIIVWIFYQVVLLPLRSRGTGQTVVQCSVLVHVWAGNPSVTHSSHSRAHHTRWGFLFPHLTEREAKRWQYMFQIKGAIVIRIHNYFCPLLLLLLLC